MHSSKKNSCGNCIMIPAPSPELFSQPQAPRCSIFSNTVNASAICWCDLLPLMLATKPIPQASCSYLGSYRPFAGATIADSFSIATFFCSFIVVKQFCYQNVAPMELNLIKQATVLTFTPNIQMRYHLSLTRYS